jgi:DNA-binding SARP family transcriptional activator
MEGKVRVQVLGLVSATFDGRPVDLGGPRQRRLLAALAVDAGHAVSGDRLTERLWGEDPAPADPRRTMRTYVGRLRHALGRDDAVATDSGGWRLDCSIVEVDAVRFAQLEDSAEDPGIGVHERLARLEEALALWRGDAYEGFGGEVWARTEVERLAELRATAIERRFDAMLAAGMHTDALPELAASVGAHPWRERLVGLQMVALFRAGRQAEATRAFQDHRRRLGDELGLEPGSDLVELDRRILAGDRALLSTQTTARALRGYRLGGVARVRFARAAPAGADRPPPPTCTGSASPSTRR